LRLGWKRPVFAKVPYFDALSIGEPSGWLISD
jgi:hypothetical protein